MDIKTIKQIMALLEQSSLTKIQVKDKDLEVCVERTYKQSCDSHKEHEKAFQSSNKEKLEKEQTSDIYITSPMVGTFYSSNAPGHAGFVNVGDLVTEDSVVCIIEAMKVMNEIRAGQKGIIKEILVDNAAAVEFGTKLFRIE